MSSCKKLCLKNRTLG